ncbi:MAG: nitrite/sulfite reductase [Deltaproteobacteria bacterium]|nr:nitrite/sulfite reductase [Deltaproteobacteria bacterium]
MHAPNAPLLPRFSDARDIDEFLEVLGRFERGELSSDAFRKFRLTRGVYGQRQEGVQMLRVKVPQGVLFPAALEALGAVAEDVGHGLGHVTTRQNLQFHFIPMAEMERALRALDAAGLTTREACGNTVRNVTACPFAGVHTAETFDVAPYGEALTRYFLRQPWAGDLPRKFKIALSCGGSAGDCAYGAINDVGLVARVRDGARGFQLLAAGGLSTSPQAALELDPFLPVERAHLACEALVRLFDRTGNRENKHRARLKYVLRRLGPEGFRRAFREEFDQALARSTGPLELPPERVELPPAPRSQATELRAEGYLPWRASNTFAQPQEGYAVAVLRLPLGAVTAAQLRGLASLCQTYADGAVRTTLDQNLALRYVPVARLPALHRALKDLWLAQPGARTVSDVTSCPGAESCNLAVTSSRAVAAAITARLETDPALAELVAAARATVIKLSGCPNSCGQHHIADLGFHGAARKVGDRTAPVYQLHLGGGVDERGARFGRQVVKLPAKRLPEAVARLLGLYAREREGSEAPSRFFERVAEARVLAALGDLATLDARTPDEDFLDVGEDTGFKVSIGAGECAA